ncbi:hypothetical protein M9Y10_022835 [Tritrichomonas musculus]|uniref:Serine/threonine-protein phosphatase n=1 Tax=Tritrichomonas musculus TaxID=1915356 RepID=A0ABR2KTG8_9EUKA
MIESYNFEELKNNYLDKGEIVPEKWVTYMCMKLIELLNSEENILLLQSPIVVCGDVHGQYEDVRELFRTADVEDEEGNFDIKKKQFLFLGDYVDRGNFSLNTFLLLAGLKLEEKDRYHLLRGNHECRQVTTQYGFYNEMMQNYGTAVLYNLVMEVFDLLPFCAIIDNEIFSTHGGLSPYMRYAGLLMNEERRNEIPNAGILADLTWSDPDDQIKQWRPNTRGAGFLFGKSQTREFCQNNGVKLVLRSHQLANQGYQWFFTNSKDDEKNDESKDRIEFEKPLGDLLLVWSAPNYAYRSGNVATILEINEEDSKKCVLKVFQPAANRIDTRGKTSNSPYFT